MKDEKVEALKKTIESVLKESQRIWDTGSESREYLIGYLEGALKMIGKELNK